MRAEIKVALIGGVVAIIAALIGIAPEIFERTTSSDVPKGRVLWEQNWHTINEPRGFMGSSGTPEAGGGTWTNREQFLAMVEGLELSQDAELEKLKAQLLRLIHSGAPHPGAEPYYNLQYTPEIRDTENRLKRGIRNKAIETGMEVKADP